MAIIDQHLSDRLDKAIQELQFLHEDLYADEKLGQGLPNLHKMQAQAEELANTVGQLMLECNIAIGQYAVQKLVDSGAFSPKECSCRE